MLIDTHCHLNAEEFRQNLDYYVNSSFENDVKQIVVIGTNQNDNQEALNIAEKYNLYATVGVHPSEVSTSTVKKIIPLLNHNRVVGIGECGIDLYWQKDNLELQKKVFQEQIELAIEYNLPLVIHTRDSFYEIIEVLEPYKGRVMGVFHCFTLGIKEALIAIDYGFYLGIGGVLTFKKSLELQEVIKKLGLENLVLETDAPYLAPTPKRGKQNEPAYLKYTALFLADLLNISYQEVAETTTRNAKKLFKIK